MRGRLWLMGALQPHFIYTYFYYTWLQSHLIEKQPISGKSYVSGLHQQTTDYMLDGLVFL